MSQTPVDFVNILVQPPGDLLFFLAVILLTQAGLFMALERRLRAPDDFAARRYVRAGVGVTVVWAALVFGGVFALLANIEARLVLPPVERVAQVVTILLLGWAFITDNQQGETRRANIVLLLVLIVVIVGYIFTGTQWPAEASAAGFSASVYGAAWTLIAAAVALFGLILMAAYFRSVTDAPVKLVFFAVLLLGYAGTLLQIVQGTAAGDYSGLARLAFLAALPVMPAVIYRLVVSHTTADASLLANGSAWLGGRAAETADGPAADAPVERESVQLLKALGVILDKPVPAEIPLQVVRAALEIARGEVGLLLTLQDANYADITCGYDMIMQRPILGMALNLDDQPTLVNAVERRTQRPLFPDRNEAELRDLYTRLDVDQHGPAYFQPLVHNNELVAVLLVGMPYSGRELNDAECERLRGIAIIASGMLALSYRASDSQLQAEATAIEAMLRGMRDEGADDSAAARLDLQAALVQSREQISTLTRQVTQLKIELDAERSRVASGLEDTDEGLSISQRMVALNEEQQRLLTERNQLLVRLQEAETALAGATADSNTDVYNTMINVLKREKEDLLAQRDSLETQLAELRRGDRSHVPAVVQDVLTGMADEKARLEVERSQLQGRLGDLEAQLAALGIENGAAGLAQLVGRLHEQRAGLQARYDALRHERDTLLSERAGLETSITQAQEREKQIEDLQKVVKNLAADREAAVKQRDALRAEREELLAKQDSIKEHRARVIAEAEAYRQELEEAQEAAVQLRRELQMLADARSNLSAQVDRLQAEKGAVEGEREQLLARVEGDRGRLEQLGADGVGSLTRIIEELTSQRAQLEHQLHDARTELAALEGQMGVLQAQALPAARPARQPQDPALILGMVQELRTPLTSIVGYVELLLSESAGILGEMQLRFLQRVAANIARLLSMMEDLTRITALDMGELTLAPEAVDLVGVIEDAITASGGQFREKGLTVHLNLADDLPPISADHDALNQIIGQLLTNAYLASPPDSEIFIAASRQPVALSNNGSRQSVDSLLVTVEDRGGGIALEDQQRVFARKYRAENPLIQGLGDTGVGMAIAKALVEAHGGVLWLETRAQVGSAFHFALPLDARAQTEG